jgi:uncharacterized protein (TIGR03435 family)
VDSVNETPTANAPRVGASLPPPVAYEVVSIRPSLPGAEPKGGRGEPGGMNYQAISLKGLIEDAYFDGELVGAPKWLETASGRFDILAKGPVTLGPGVTDVLATLDDLRPKLRAVLADRFKLAVHSEEQPLDVYTLVSAKPKLKPADPSNRTGCKIGTPQVAKGPVSGPPPVELRCQNVTMAQFADALTGWAGGVMGASFRNYPVIDATGIEGAWDITLTFSLAAPASTADQSPAGGAPVASDPGGGPTLFEALNKQLGLKLEMHKRPEPVLVIDHVEENPTDN